MPTGIISLVTGLIKLAGVIADYMQQRQLLDAGAKAQIARDMMALNERLSLGIRIQNEQRSIDDDLAILKGGGARPVSGGVPGEPKPPAG